VGDSYILVVEDRGEDVELTLRAFQKAGVSSRVQVLHDGLEALEFLQGVHPFSGEVHDAAPALMLVDVKLPRMDGIQLLQRVRKLEKMRYVPIIMVTSSEDSLDLRASYDNGANSFIRKPPVAADFTLVVSRMCEYWLGVNEQPGA
jgi:two-component system response regulator